MPDFGLCKTHVGTTGEGLSEIRVKSKERAQFVYLNVYTLNVFARLDGEESKTNLRVSMHATEREQGSFVNDLV